MKHALFTRKAAAVLSIGLGLAGCSTVKHAKLSSQIIGDSVVLIGTQSASLAFAPAQGTHVQVRSTYESGLEKTVVYEPGRDYILDHARGEIRRTADSRIPDFATNMLYSVEDFDHGKYPGFGNERFFAYVDYRTADKGDWPAQESQLQHLPATRNKLLAGGRLKIVAFGDSITAGGDASSPRLIYWQRWADALRKRYPAATVEIVNGATGGDTTRNGLDRLEAKVLSQSPDLVLVAFGMNDHNIGGYGTPLEEFRRNLEAIVSRIRAQTGAEVILLSTFPPNSKWRYGSRNMEAYAKATEDVARTNNCAFVNIYGNWTFFLTRKKPEDLLGNNINHPNDFGHWIYFEILDRVGL